MTGDAFYDRLLVAIVVAPITAILTFLVTIATQVAMRRYTVRTETIQDQIDELCADVRELASAAAEYWLTDPADPKELTKLEAKVFGLYHRVSSSFGLLGEEMDDLRTVAQDLLVDLHQATTGGNFQVAGRAAEPQRYMRIEHKAAAFVKEVRRFHRHRLRGIFRSRRLN